MTREKMVKNLDYLAKFESDEYVLEGINAASSELRKSCAGCEHFAAIDLGEDVSTIVGQCDLARHRYTPADGSGYCRPGYEPKETR